MDWPRGEQCLPWDGAAVLTLARAESSSLSMNRPTPTPPRRGRGGFRVALRARSLGMSLPARNEVLACPHSEMRPLQSACAKESWQVAIFDYAELTHAKSYESKPSYLDSAFFLLDRFARSKRPAASSLYSGWR